MGSILGSPYFGTTMGEKLALPRGFRPKRPAASLVIVHIYVYMYREREREREGENWSYINWLFRICKGFKGCLESS